MFKMSDKPVTKAGLAGNVEMQPGVGIEVAVMHDDFLGLRALL